MGRVSKFSGCNGSNSGMCCTILVDEEQVTLPCPLHGSTTTYEYTTIYMHTRLANLFISPRLRRYLNHISGASDDLDLQGIGQKCKYSSVLHRHDDDD
jgi:hypothetical protein